MKGNVLVGQSGGPTAVINSSLAGVFKTAMERGFSKVYGMRNGIQGFLDEQYVDLSDYIKNELDLELLKRTPSAFLGTCRYKLPEIHEDKAIYERIFEPLGIGFPIWENCPQGHPIGGGGMYLKLTQMMKLGQLYLADGKWDGKQLVDPAWIREATSVQIETPCVTEGEKADYWRCGYGYQFWMSPYEKSYRADGAFGQITTVLPAKGLVVAVQNPQVSNLDWVKKELHERVFLQL